MEPSAPRSTLLAEADRCPSSDSWGTRASEFATEHSAASTIRHEQKSAEVSRGQRAADKEEERGRHCAIDKRTRLRL